MQYLKILRKDSATAHYFHPAIVCSVYPGGIAEISAMRIVIIMSLVYAFFADGFEEIEGLTIVDLLRRTDIEIEIVSITDKREVTGAHNIIIQTDKIFNEIDIDRADVLFLPGGVPGTPNLAAHEGLIQALKKFNDNGKRIAAICAAPSILGELEMLNGKRATCYPGYEDKLTGAKYVRDKAVTDGNITTARGMGTSIELGLELISLLISKEKADEIAEKIQFV